LTSMAIHNHEQLAHTQQKIAALELALEEMKREETSTAYAVLSKGFIAQIEQMRHEIDRYLGIGHEAEESELIST
jgi:TATA-binding protein-associated factor Taf7